MPLFFAFRGSEASASCLGGGLLRGSLRLGLRPARYRLRLPLRGACLRRSSAACGGSSLIVAASPYALRRLDNARRVRAVVGAFRGSVACVPWGGSELTDLLLDICKRPLVLSLKLAFNKVIVLAFGFVRDSLANPLGFVKGVLTNSSDPPPIRSPSLCRCCVLFFCPLAVAGSPLARPAYGGYGSVSLAVRSAPRSLSPPATASRGLPSPLRPDLAGK